MAQSNAVHFKKINRIFAQLLSLVGIMPGGYAGDERFL
jgi:hypothetical protein